MTPDNDRPIIHPKKRAFLAAMAQTGNIAEAAGLAGINRNTHYRWLKHDPHYASAFDNAVEEAADRLEQEARRRAVHGFERPVFHQGEECGSVRQYSDRLLIFLLKGARPEKYAERVAGEISTPGGQPLRVIIENLNPEVFGGDKNGPT